MNSKQAKSFIASLLPKGTRLAARTVSKRFLEVRIRPTVESICSGPLVFPAELPLALRQAAIKAVYPNSPKLHAQAAAGNVDSRCICISPEEWDAAALEYCKTV